MRALEQEIMIYRGNLSELEAANMKDTNSLRQQMTDMRYENEDLMRQLQRKNEESHIL